LSPIERLEDPVATLLAALTSYNENCPQKLQLPGGDFEGLTEKGRKFFLQRAF
jgi:hypothetical protein